jgi:hypothetical protein
MENKLNKYHSKDEVSFERQGFLTNTFMKGTILSCKYVYYRWVYLVECSGDKKLLTLPEDQIWPLDKT